MKGVKRNYRYLKKEDRHDSEREGIMSMRAIVFVVVPVIILVGAATAAVALPGGCPSSFHRLSGTTCVSDATHIAPSSGVRIPESTMPIDQRMTLRLEIVAVALVGAAGFLWIGTGSRRPSEPGQADSTTTERSYAPGRS
jgi:hypothetical protein